MSSTAIELAKKLLQKGRALNDLELISMANDMLEEAMGGAETLVAVHTEQSEPKPKAKRGRPVKAKARAKQSPAIKTSKSLIEEFTIARPEEKTKSIPVNKLPRTNTWFDDGTEAKGDVTPDYIPTKRDRPRPQKIRKICGQAEGGKMRDDEGCGAVAYVDPGTSHREFFLCDECIRKKVRR